MFILSGSLAHQEDYAAEKTLDLIDNALAKLQAEKQWSRNNLEIDSQVEEASFIFRRILQSILGILKNDRAKA